MNKRQNIPPINAVTAKFYWIALMLGGMLLVWAFYCQWPPLTHEQKLTCLVYIGAGCFGLLALALGEPETTADISRFYSMRAAIAAGMPFPTKNSGMWGQYKIGLACVLSKAMAHVWFCTGCAMKMPWGWLAILMHVVFNAGAGILRTKRPEWFDGSDPDMMAAAFLTIPALDFIIGALIAVAAWYL